MADSLVILRAVTDQEIVEEKYSLRLGKSQGFFIDPLKKIQEQLKTILFNDIEGWKKHLGHI